MPSTIPGTTSGRSRSEFKASRPLKRDRASETAAGTPLIREQRLNAQVYLVLSGRLSISLKGEPLRDTQGRPVQALAGNIVGQISALGDTVATATVSGEAVVLGISGALIRARFEQENTLPELMGELSAYHFATLHANGYADGV